MTDKRKLIPSSQTEGRKILARKIIEEKSGYDEMFAKNLRLLKTELHARFNTALSHLFAEI